MISKNNLLRFILFQICSISLLILLPIPATPNSSSSTSSTKPSVDLPPPEISSDVYFKTDGIVSGPPAPKLNKEDYLYPNILSGVGGSRVIIWVLAQQHLYFGGLVLGVLFLVTFLELKGVFSKNKDSIRRDDRFAHEMLRLMMLVFSLTAILGGIFLLGLLALYPDVMKYLASVFRPFFLVYGVLLLGFNAIVYLYERTWRRMSLGSAKALHVGLGLLGNFIGTAILLLTNSWSSFMTSPSGVDNQGRFLGNYWNVLHNPLWISTSVHRFFGNILFGGAVIAAYAAYQTLTARRVEEREYYDRMGFAAFLAIVFALFTLPFGGVWLLRETYTYRQQMGITLLGGLLAWLGVVLVILVGAFMIGINYYLWQRIEISSAAERYRPQSKYILLIMTICLLIYITPHTLVITPAELKAMGGAQHPVIGNYGVESSKQPAINIIMICTLWTLIQFWKSLYERGNRSRWNTALIALFLAGILNIIGLGIYGYFIPANVRIGLLAPMFMSTLSVALFGFLFTRAFVSRSKRIDSPTWGNLSVRGYYTLFFLAVTVTWLMGLGGYRRSALRLHWHVNEILRDNSPWAFTPPLGFVGNVLTVNTMLFWGSLLFIFWLAKLQTTPLISEKAKIPLPGEGLHS